MNALGFVVFDCLAGVERRGGGVSLRRLYVGLVSRTRVPGAGVIIRHQIPEVEIAVHAADVHHLVVRGPGRTRNGEFEMVFVRQRSAVRIHGFPACFEQQDEVFGFRRGLGIFPVNV